MFGFFGPADRRVLNQVVHLVLVWIVKWRNSNDHLVNKNAKCPPVERFVVSRAHNHLWRQILRRATEGVRLLTVLLHDLGEAKVCQRNVTIVVE